MRCSHERPRRAHRRGLNGLPLMGLYAIVAVFLVPVMWSF
jgi:hypothetical protein